MTVVRRGSGDSTLSSDWVQVPLFKCVCVCVRDRPRFPFRNAEVQAIPPSRATASLFRRVFAVSMKPTRLGKRDSTQPSRATVCRDPGDSTVSSNVSGHQRVPFFYLSRYLLGQRDSTRPCRTAVRRDPGDSTLSSHRFSPRFCGGRLVLAVSIKKKKKKKYYTTRTQSISSRAARLHATQQNRCVRRFRRLHPFQAQDSALFD